MQAEGSEEGCAEQGDGEKSGQGCSLMVFASMWCQLWREISTEDRGGGQPEGRAAQRLSVRTSEDERQETGAEGSRQDPRAAGCLDAPGQVPGSWF